MWQRCHVIVIIELACSVSTPISPCEQWLAGWVVVLET
jgi:hypothetical protein